MTDFAWTHLLYRLYDAEDQLLYIGRTNDLKQRFAQHSKVQPWWGDVARSAVETLPDLDTLKSAEKTAILDERPLHNIVYNGRPLTESDGVDPRWLAISPRVTAVADLLHHTDCGVPDEQRPLGEPYYDDADAPPCRSCGRHATEILTVADKAEGRVDEAMEAARAQINHEASLGELAKPIRVEVSSREDMCGCTECTPRWAARNKKKRELLDAATKPTLPRRGQPRNATNNATNTPRPNSSHPPAFDQ